MADQESKVTIKGKDEFSPVVKGMTKTVQELTKELEKSLKIGESQARALQSRANQTNRSYLELLQTIKKNNDAYNDNLKTQRLLNQAAADGGEKQVTVQKKINDALTGVLKSHLSIMAAAEASRRAYLGYAETEKKLLLLQNQTKMTTAEMKGFEAQVKATAKVTQTTGAETMDVFNKIRTGLGVTMDQATKMGGQLNIVAKGLGEAPLEFAKSVTDMMRNMKAAPEEFNDVMEMIAASTRDAGVEISGVTARGAELAETAASIGLKGREGIATLLGMLGEATDQMGDTHKGAMMLRNTFQQLASPQMGEIMRGNADRWRAELDEVKAKGGDAATYSLEQFRKIRDKEAAYAKMGEKERLFVRKQMEDENHTLDQKVQKIRAAAGGTQAMTDGARAMLGMKGGVDDLTNSLSLLSDEFGKLMRTMGVPDIINMFTKELERLGSIVQWINQLFAAIKSPAILGGTERFPDIIGPHGYHGPGSPHPFGSTAWSSMTAVPGGLTGSQATEDAKKRLDEAMKRRPGAGAAVAPGALGVQGAPGWTPGPYTPLPGGATVQQQSYVPGQGAVGGGGSGYGGDGAGGGYQGMVHPASLGGGRGVGTPAGASVPGARSALLGLTGQGRAESEQRYGSSMDAKYLTAAYHPGGTVPGGGGGGGGGGGAAAGPGAYGGGTGYGGQTQIPTRDKGDGSPNAPGTPPTPTETGPGGLAVQPGTVAPVLGPELGGPQPGAAGAVPPGYGGLVDPITGKLGGGLGDYRSGGGGHAHQGVDLLAPHGSPIFAAGGGTIIKHSPRGSFQKDAVTTVRLDDGRTVRYMHHKLDPNLKVGSRLAPGQQIGSSGTAAGVGHLHYEIRDPHGKLLDPIATHGWKRGRDGRTPVGGMPSGGAQPTTAARPPAPQAAPAPGGTSVRGSWFGNAPGGWRDPSEPVDSPKSNVPGIALPDKRTKGQMFVVTTPDGRQYVLPQTDVGPHSRTGRGIDITAPAAKQMGYTPSGKNAFPTDARFQYRPYDPAKDAHLLERPGSVAAEPTVRPTAEMPPVQAQSLFNTQTGEWIPGSGDAAPSGSSSDWGKDFRRSANIEDRRDDPRLQGGGHVKLGNRLRMNNAEIVRKWTQGNELNRNLPEPTPLSKALGSDDLDRASRDKQVNLNLKVNDDQVQFARTSMRRQADKEVREARWNSYSDIGAA